MTPRIFIPSLALATILPATAQINASWSGTVNQQWNVPDNWTTLTVPCNVGTTTYNAFLGGGAGTVVMPSTCALEFLELQLGAEISLNNGVTLTVHDAITNNGVISPNSTGSTTGLHLADAGGGMSVTIAGQGDIVLSHENDRITGTTNHTFHNGGGHTVRGYGQIAANSVSILNEGSIIADNQGNTLVVDPRTTMTQNGDLVATGGGILRLESATYNVHPSASSILVGDQSEIQLNGITMNGGSLDAGNTDGDLSNNRVVVTGNSTISGTRNQAHLAIDNARSLTISGPDMVNNGDIVPESAAGISDISFNDGSDLTIAIGGPGRILLDKPNDRIVGTTNHTLVHNSPHLIEGGGQLGANTISFVNNSNVIANNAGVPLDIDPRTSWINDGAAGKGLLSATGGADINLFQGAYTCQNGGRFLIGDGSELTLNSTTMVQPVFDVDNLNGTLADNTLRIAGNSSFDGGTNNATLHVDNNRTLTINGADLTNNATIHLDSSGNTTQVSISDTSDNTMRILGTGKIELDHASDRITGTTNHLLDHAASHTIEGHGALGTNSINILNRGLISSNVSGETLVVDPVTSFTNDAGTLQAVDGGMINFAQGIYTSVNGGRFLLGDGSRFDLAAVTMHDLVLDVIDTNLDLSDNLAHVVTNSTFRDVTNEANLRVDDNRSITILNGDLTNNATITLDGDTADSSLSFSDGSDLLIELLGTGTVFLDDPRDKITGTTNHTLVHGEDHTIAVGAIGLNAINVLNHGDIIANRNGETLTIDPRTSVTNDGGILEATNGSIIHLAQGTYTTVNGGRFLLGDNCRFDLAAVTMHDMTLEVADLDANLANNLAHIITTSTFTDVTNETNLHVDNGRTINITSGDLTNNATITLDGTIADSYLSISDSSDLIVSLLGKGTVFLDEPARDKITGTTNHFLVHGEDHTIEGAGAIGINAINVVNHGLINANITGQTLTIDPRTSFVNDGGKLHASDGAKVSLLGGSYSSANGGDYRIFDGASFELSGLTLTGMTLDVDNGNGTLADNTATMTNTCTFTDMTNNARVLVNDSRILSVTPGDLTNNGEIELGSTGGTTSISISGPGDLIVSFFGTGRILLDGATERIIGTTNHFLINESGHTIEGGGAVGTGAIHLVNRGIMTAKVPGTPLVLDDRSGGIPNSGTLQALNTSILDINDPLLHTDGLVFAETGSSIDCSSGFTQYGGTTRIDGNLVATSMNVAGGIVQGTGNIDSSLTANYCLVSPGNSTGTLSIDSAILGAGSALRIEVNATGDADQLAVTAGALNPFGGALQLVYTGGPTSVQPTDVFTIVTAVGGVGGANFINAADGQRLTTIDGSASFIVNYNPNSVTLTDFIYNPGGATNEAPVITTGLAIYNVPENTALGTTVATFEGYDPEGGLITWSLTPGQPFAIDPNTGVLTVTGPLDYESQTTYNLVVTASDGSLQTDLPITINIDNVIDTNQEVVTSVLSAPGGAFPGVTDLNIVGVAADPDGDGTLNIFELWRGTDAATADLPTPLILEPFFISAEDRGSVIVETDPAMDDQLVIEVEFSFDLENWRNTTANRSVLSGAGGIRTLRFHDTEELPSGTPFFVRFLGDPAAMP